MTVDTGSDRAVLEKKRNDELVVIATALGLTPPARAKKADLVELIMSGRGASASTATKAGATKPAPAEPAGEAQAEQAPQRRLIRSHKVSEPAAEAAPAWEGGASRPAVSPLTRFEPAAILPPPIVVEVAAGKPEGRESSTNGASRRYANNGDGGQRTPREPSESPRGEQEQRPERETGDGLNSRRRDKKRRGRGDGREIEGRHQPDQAPAELIPFAGLLDLRDEGFGFVRSNGYLPSPKDIYVSVNVVRRFGLRKGDSVEGAARSASGSEKYPALQRLDKVNGMEPEEAKLRPKFEELTPLFPDENLRLEVPGELSVTARIIDLVSPIGKGQRGLIVSPPKAGKTTVMKEIARCIEANNPEVYLMMLLVDERPEEVTDIRRSVRGEVVASTFDRPSEEHVAVAELAIERAKRMVEMGRDVVIILDGITRLTRAYNLALPPTGRIMSGGVDSGAIYPPKKFFGAARNVEEGGSLTILATALVETGSRMDEVIFEEFKGTGNMELRLDRRLAERRLYPAIDVNASSTRHEELLFQRDQLNLIWKLRRVLNALTQEGSSAPGLELLIDKIRQTRSNADFLAEIAKSPNI
ncbi:MAG: transcription termination factor Rho [Actinomycetota bacterium]|nr:transcription termination factor Rho [Actinomycetota bacterium]MDA8207575.1 transcription termination factor Rho [Actinomycetota bacterium]